MSQRFCNPTAYKITKMKKKNKHFDLILLNVVILMFDLNVDNLNVFSYH